MKVNAVIVEIEKTYAAEIPVSLQDFESILGGQVSIVKLPHGLLMVCREEKGSKINKTVLGTQIYDDFLLLKYDYEKNQIISISNEFVLRKLVEIFSKNIIKTDDLDNVALVHEYSIS